eukprot:5146409-Prymnesium_polylepis.1
MSPDEDARALSTGEKASDQMARLWPLRHAASRSCRPSSIDHSLIVRSCGRQVRRCARCGG